MERLLTATEAALRVGVAAKTLANWRVLGRGPKFIRAGTRVAYDPVDIESWKADRRFNSTSEQAA